MYSSLELSQLQVHHQLRYLGGPEHGITSTRFLATSGVSHKHSGFESWAGAEQTGQIEQHLFVRVLVQDLAIDPQHVATARMCYKWLLELHL